MQTAAGVLPEVARAVRQTPEMEIRSLRERLHSGLYDRQLREITPVSVQGLLRQEVSVRRHQEVEVARRREVPPRET